MIMQEPVIGRELSKGHSLRAAVVEDDEFVAATMSIKLKKLGIVSDVYGSLAAARGRVKKSIYNFAIVDLHLPDGGGFELIKEIRNTEENRGFPIIVATSNKNLKVAMDAYDDFGVILVCNKPIDWSCLEYVIQSTVLEEAS